MSSVRLPVACFVAVAAAAATAVWYGSGDAAQPAGNASADGQQQAGQQQPERPAAPRTEEEKRALSEYMRAKLASSSQILEGLCTEDFDLIAKGARELGQISTTEKWRISNDAIYRHHSAEFTRIVKELEKSAGEKALEGCSLRWIEATMSCIECHRFVRAIRIAGEE